MDVAGAPLLLREPRASWRSLSVADSPFVLLLLPLLVVPGRAGNEEGKPLRAPLAGSLARAGSAAAGRL